MSMTRDDVLRIVREAGANGAVPDLRSADLSGANLSGAHLSGADLSGANLSGANLSGAHLSHANLRDAHLRDAYLRDAHLRAAYLRRANLRGADLRGANLRGADLRGANLSWALWSGANLRGANLSWALWSGLRIDNLPSGQLTFTPTPTGWHLRVGCWAGTVDGLETLALSDDEAVWPEAHGEQIAHRRPLLLAAVALCRAHIDSKPGTIDDLAERWADNDRGTK